MAAYIAYAVVRMATGTLPRKVASMQPSAVVTDDIFAEYLRRVAEAGQVAEAPSIEDAAEGTDPAYIIGQQRELRTCEPITRAQFDAPTLGEARNRINRAMRDYMLTEDPEHVLLVTAPPGIGKTWQGVSFAHWYKANFDKRLFYAGPRTDFFPEVLFTASRQEQDPAAWYAWLSRQKNEEDRRLHTCNYADEINLWLAKNHGGMDFCAAICKWDYVNDGCRYHGQKDRLERLLYGNHNHVTLGHPLASDFGVVLGDEDPLDAFIDDIMIPASGLYWSDLPYEEPLTEVLHDLQALCANDAKVSGAALWRALDARRVVEACELFDLPRFASPRLWSPSDVQQAPYAFLQEFVAVAMREALATLEDVDFPERVYLSGGYMTLLNRRYVNDRMPKHCIWFDATGNERLYKAMFGRDVQVVDVQPKLRGRFIQVTDRANGKSSLLKYDKATGAEAPTAKALQLKQQVDVIAKDFEQPVVVTFLDLEEQFAQDGRDTMHFYAARGSNLAEGCDALIIAGTPNPRRDQVERIAKSLWLDRMEPFDTRWITEYRQYNYIDEAGNAWEYPISDFVDPDLSAILWSKRDAEVIQCAHRVRPLSREVPVFLLSNLPVDQLPPSKLLTIGDLLQAPEKVNVFLWAEVYSYAIECADAYGYVTSALLVDRFGIDKRTARKYIDHIIALDGWEAAAVREGRGKPPKAAKPWKFA